MEKKITLVKREDRYDLYGEQGEKIASSAPNTSGNLSKENCDELFGIIDVEKWAKEYVDEDSNLEIGTSENHNAQVDFKAGFNKAMELNKYKVFTIEDVKKAMMFAVDFRDWTVKDSEMVSKYGLSCNQLNPRNSIDVFIQSLQQPNEIEVTFDSEEKDSDGCLILTKI